MRPWTALIVGTVVFFFVGCAGAGAGRSVGSGAPTPQLSTIETTFSDGHNGWTTSGDAQDSPSVTWDSAGYIEATDQGAGSLWYFVAPEAYLGDKSGYYGGTFQYELMMLAGAPNSSDWAELVLESSNKTIVVDLGKMPAIDEWTTFSAALDTREDWRLDSTTGDLATANDIEEVLSDLQALRVLGEFDNRAGDRAALDNVRMIPAAP
jgi:hypothetical protein